MAGRTSSTRSCALLVAAAAAVAGMATSRAGAAPAKETGPIVLAQLDTNASIPFGRMDQGWNKRVAQVFVPPAEAHKLARVSLILAGDDATALVKVYEVGKKPPFGTLLRKSSVVADQQWGEPGGPEWQRVAVRPALRMDPGKRYGIVLKVADRSVSMTAAGGSGYEAGAEWCRCPRQDPDGGIDWDDLSWQPDEYGTDLTFRLRFWRRG